MEESVLVDCQRKAVYKACVRHLKKNDRFSNFFVYCSHYAKTVVLNELTPSDECYEIPALDTKNGLPYVVFFK